MAGHFVAKPQVPAAQVPSRNDKMYTRHCTAPQVNHSYPANIKLLFYVLSSVEREVVFEDRTPAHAGSTP